VASQGSGGCSGNGTLSAAANSGGATDGVGENLQVDLVPGFAVADVPWHVLVKPVLGRRVVVSGGKDKLDTLNGFAFYRQAPVALQARIAAAAEPLSVAAGADLYRQDDECRELAFVGRGSVRIFKTGETGREITLYHVQQGQSCLVNMLAVLVGKPAVATARSVVSTEGVVIPGAAMREWVRTSDLVRDYVIETMAERLIDVMTLFEEVAFGKMDTRLTAFLLHRFGSGPFISATHEEIAAELGTAREVVTRLLKEFVRSGAIAVGRGRLELRDEAVLRERS
jgi:CRP/FNR family transcriptional regulator, anaerobic regulatory protein